MKHGIMCVKCDEGATTLRSIAHALNRRGIKSPRGGTWHPSSVANLLSRPLLWWL